MVSDHETDLRNSQEQSSKPQIELKRLRQEKTCQEDAIIQQISEVEEKTRKDLLMSDQKITSMLMDKPVFSNAHLLCYWEYTCQISSSIMGYIWYFTIHV